MIYLGTEAREPEILAKLGKHRATNGSLYVKKLADIDLKALKATLKKSIAVKRKTYPEK